MVPVQVAHAQAVPSQVAPVQVVIFSVSVPEMPLFLAGPVGAVIFAGTGDFTAACT